MLFNFYNCYSKLLKLLRVKKDMESRNTGNAKEVIENLQQLFLNSNDTRGISEARNLENCLSVIEKDSKTGLIDENR